MAARTFAARIARVDSAGDDSLIPRFLLGVSEDASLHPVGAFAVAATAILAFLWFQVAQVLKHQKSGFMLLGELDNASTHQVCEMLIGIPDLAPEISIILFAFRYETSL
jgi:hypothetical protein